VLVFSREVFTGPFLSSTRYTIYIKFLYICCGYVGFLVRSLWLSWMYFLDGSLLYDGRPSLSLVVNVSVTLVVLIRRLYCVLLCCVCCVF
jgi:hypothetical protein